MAFYGRRFFYLKIFLLVGYFATSVIRDNVFALASEKGTVLSLERLSKDAKDKLSISTEQIEQLHREIASLKKDQKTLIQTLMNATKSEQNLTQSLDAHKVNLKKLLAQQQEKEKIVLKYKEDFIQIAGILERMGVAPSSLLLGDQETGSLFLRRAFLLGSFLHISQKKINFLAKTLSDLVESKEKIEKEQKLFRQKLEQQQLEREKIRLLLAEKAKLEKNSLKSLQEEQQKNVLLSKKAQNFSQLLNLVAKETKERKEKILPFLQKMSNFEALKGQLLRPILGKIVAYYEPYARPPIEGEAIESKPNAPVYAPAFGLVVFSGPFRSYGEIVILDVGSGYHILLAGLKSVTIKQGHFVLKGESIGVMGEGPAYFTLTFIQHNIKHKTKEQALNPILYVELRKDGKIIDPTPWWESIH